MTSFQLCITVLLLLPLTSRVTADEFVQWEFPDAKKCLVFPAGAKAGSRALTAILAEPAGLPRSCSVRFRLDFDNLTQAKERVEKAHPGWTIQRVTPSEVIAKAELMLEEDNGKLSTIRTLAPNALEKTDSFILNENGLSVSIVVRDEQAKAARDDSKAALLFERLQQSDPRLRFRLMLALAHKHSVSVSAAYIIDTAVLATGLATESFTRQEIEQVCQAAVKWEKGSDSPAIKAELVSRLITNLKLIEPSPEQSSSSSPKQSHAASTFVLADRAKKSSKIGLTLKDSFSLAAAAEEREMVYQLKDWNQIAVQEYSLSRSDKPVAKTSDTPKSDEAKPDRPESDRRKSDQPKAEETKSEKSETEKNNTQESKPDADKPDVADAVANQQKDLWELFSGPKGLDHSRGALPLRLSVDTTSNLGFRLVKYSMTNDPAENSEVSNFPAPKQGGYLQFHLLAPKPSDSLGGKVVPVALAWTALEMRLGPKVELRTRKYEQPIQLAFHIDAKLSRSEIDLLWNPAAAEGLNAPKRMTNRAPLPLIRSHVVIGDHLLIEDTSSFAFRADRRKFYDACQAWANRTSPPFAASTSGRVAIPCSTDQQVNAFVEFCIDQPVLFSQLTPRPSSKEQRLALFTQLRQAWLKYDLQARVNTPFLECVACPLDDHSGLIETLERPLSGWSVVERYRFLETNTENADWTLEEIYVHGYQRETEQRVHFWPVGTWEESGIQSVGIEVQFMDAKSSFSKSQKLLIPVDRPFTWQFKSRYSEQLSLRWRVIACRMKDGGVKTALQPVPWETKEPASVFDEIVYLDDSAASSVLGSNSSGS